MFQDELSAAIECLMNNGCLPRLCKLIDLAWQANLKRHDPALGDDNQTPGLLTAKNITNRARYDAQLNAPSLGTTAVVVENSLEVRSAGYTLKSYKLPGLSAQVDVHSISWDGSEARAAGPRENSRVVREQGLPGDVPSVEPGVEQLSLVFTAEGEQVFRDLAPELFRLHLAHTADQETGEIALYIGFPRDAAEGSPWYVVQPLRPADGDPRWKAGEDQPTEPPTGEMLPYDGLPLSKVPIRIRPERPVGDASS